MAEGDTDRRATIFEDEHIAHVGQTAELVRPVTPNLDQVLDVADGLLTEG